MDLLEARVERTYDIPGLWQQNLIALVRILRLSSRRVRSVTLTVLFDDCVQVFDLL